MTCRLGESIYDIALDARVTALEEGGGDAGGGGMNLRGLPLYLYGGSHALVSGVPYFTPGEHYSEQVAEALNGGSVTSYAIGGKRIIDVLSGIINGAPFPGIPTVPIAGSEYPGVSARPGVQIIDCMFNDLANYADMAAPVPVSYGGDAYGAQGDALLAQYVAACALLLAESRIEAASFTTNGTWTRALAQGYVSGGFVDFTTEVGAWAEVVVPAGSIPQKGPMAGKVAVLQYTLDAGVATMAPIDITCDGVSAQIGADMVPFVQYAEVGGGDVNAGAHIMMVLCPLDGGDHTIRVAHNGAPGDIMYNNCALVFSEEPNPVLILGSEQGAAVGLFDATEVADLKSNMVPNNPNADGLIYRLANTEGAYSTWGALEKYFDGAVTYVPSSITENGLYSADGLHLNDRAQDQREADVIKALDTPRVEGIAQAFRPDGDFGVI